MLIFVNENNEIKDVGNASDTSLTCLEINDEDNPFSNWSVAKICCYKVNVSDGMVTMMTPYVDSRLIEHIDKMGIVQDELLLYQAEMLEQLCEIQLPEWDDV